jgi:hypothetical protein
MLNLARYRGIEPLFTDRQSVVLAITLIPQKMVGEPRFELGYSSLSGKRLKPDSATRLSINFWQMYKDLNPDQMDWNHLCCQLHHTSTVIINIFKDRSSFLKLVIFLLINYTLFYSTLSIFLLHYQRLYISCQPSHNSYCLNPPIIAHMMAYLLFCFLI